MFKKFVLATLLVSIFFCNSFSQERPKIGLVLSGGGAKGLAHIGVLKVIEESGIPIDYIGGTSMGGIIGGLYSIGYSASELEDIMQHQNWDYLLSDQINRIDLGFNDKEDNGKYFVPIPVKNGRFSIPSGLLYGQRISGLLNNLCIPAYGIRDFNKLPIPFLCIGADIEKGEQVILNKGYLPEALRATMAIPNVFTPVKIDNKLLVDGGVFNNLPVDEIKDMGADIIIAINVSFKPYSQKELKESFGKMLEQSMFIHVYKKNLTKEPYCNILIEPNLKKYNASSFKNSAELVKLGEEEGRKYLKQLKDLADQLKIPKHTPKKTVLERPSEIKITRVSFTGNNSISEEILLKQMGLKNTMSLKTDNLQHLSDKLYATRYFKTVNYRINKEEDETHLEFIVEEEPKQNFFVGLHYDNYLKASIKLKYEHQNLFFGNTRWINELNLGENIHFMTKFHINTKWKQNFNLSASLSDFNLLQYEDGEKISPVDYKEFNLRFETTNSFANFYSIGGGIEGEISKTKGILFVSDDYIFNYKLLNLFGYIKFDTYNRTFFPTSGGYLNYEVKKFNIIDNNIRTNAGTIMKTTIQKAIKLDNIFTFLPRVFAGITIGDTIPLSHNFYLGGSRSNIKGATPFIGLRFLEIPISNFLVLRADIQGEISRNNFITFRFNMARVIEKPEQVLKKIEPIYGYGLSYGYLSFIGPIELTVMANNYDHKPFIYFKIGHLF